MFVSIEVDIIEYIVLLNSCCSTFILYADMIYIYFIHIPDTNFPFLKASKNLCTLALFAMPCVGNLA